MRPRSLSKALAAAAAVCGTGLAGCVAHPVGPARTFSKYEGKAVSSAKAAQSSVATVQLVAATAAAGKAFGPYTVVSVSEQEDGLSALEGTFASIQPPDRQADALRDELGAILSSAVDHVADVRIAARRGHLDELDRVAAPLEDDAAALDAFVARHG
jgi:hypothetical protein